MSSFVYIRKTAGKINIFRETLHNVILKIMKGDDNFRSLSKSIQMCSNEVHVYKEIIPFFKKYLKDNNATLFNPDDWWTPRVYFADTGIFPALSDGKETLVALENLKTSGYRMGPKIDLDEAHLRLMIKNIALYHSLSYALRITKNPMLHELASKLEPLSFLSDKGEELKSYKRLFTVGMERFFNLIDKDSKYHFSEGFLEDVNNFKSKFFAEPMLQMEKYLKRDDTFSIILHGDYVRNNVLFKYGETDGFDNPKGVKMYDFQEIRFATPAIDTAFFMYMNIHQSQRDELWEPLLQYYHETLIASLTDILKCETSDPRLTPYSFTNFQNHFARHAFYGVVVSLHYVPWIASPLEDTQQIAHWFETDMNGKEFHQITQTCGGADVDDRIVTIVKHASDKGYMKTF